MNIDLNTNKKHIYKIHDKLYDLAEFVKIHPGGVDMFNNLKPNINITPLVYSYHKNPKGILEILPKYEIPMNELIIAYDSNFTYEKYCELKKFIYDEIHEKKLPLYWSYSEITYNGLSISLYFGLWIYCFTNASNLSSWWMVLLAIMNTTNINLIFHEVSHYTGFKNQKMNSYLTMISYHLICSKDWQFIHNFIHHCFTNSPDDSDFIIPNQVHRHSVDQPYIFFHRFQSLYSFIIFGIAFIYRGVIMSIKEMKPNFLCIFLILYFFGLYNTTLLYGLSSLIFAFIAQLSHIQPECIIDNKDQKNDFLCNQVTSAINYRTDDNFTRLISFGLDIQIEHHLFPTIPHSTLRQIQHVVRDYCKKNNIRYIENANMYQSMVSYLKYFYEMSKPPSL